MNTKCDVCGGLVSTEIWVKDSYRLVRCAGCGLVYVANPPTAEQLQQLYSFESGYHQELVKSDRDIAQHEGEARANLDSLVKSAKPGLLLDVGCSTGLFLLEAQRVGWQVRGLEYSPDSARIAREQNKLDVAQGALVKGKYAPESFDVVTMWDVIEHLPSPSAAMDVVMEILKPGGLFIAKTPNVDGLYPKASLSVAGKVGFWGHPEPPGHLYQFSTKTLAKLFTDKGLEVDKVYQQRIPVAYSFGTVQQWFRSLRWMAYTTIFAPMVVVGPLVGRGDAITMVARKSAR